MTWALPITACIVMFWLAYMQFSRMEFEREMKNLERADKIDLDTSQLYKEFQDYKKRVDSLTLKAGFKL